jgi:hypothetical protein
MITGSYMNFGDFGKGKNKAKTNPIKANLSQIKPKTKPIFGRKLALCDEIMYPVFYADFTRKIVCLICYFNHIIFINLLKPAMFYIVYEINMVSLYISAARSRTPINRERYYDEK